MNMLRPYEMLDVMVIEEPKSVDAFAKVTANRKGMIRNKVVTLHSAERARLLKAVHLLLPKEGHFVYTAKDLGKGYQHGGLSPTELWAYMEFLLVYDVKIYLYRAEHNYWDIDDVTSPVKIINDIPRFVRDNKGRSGLEEAMQSVLNHDYERGRKMIEEYNKRDAPTVKSDNDPRGFGHIDWGYNGGQDCQKHVDYMGLAVPRLLKYQRGLHGEEETFVKNTFVTMTKLATTTSPHTLSRIIYRAGIDESFAKAIHPSNIVPSLRMGAQDTVSQRCHFHFDGLNGTIPENAHVFVTGKVKVDRTTGIGIRDVNIAYGRKSLEDAQARIDKYHDVVKKVVTWARKQPAYMTHVGPEFFASLEGFRFCGNDLMRIRPPCFQKLVFLSIVAHIMENEAISGSLKLTQAMSILVCFVVSSNPDYFRYNTMEMIESDLIEKLSKSDSCFEVGWNLYNRIEDDKVRKRFSGGNRHQPTFNRRLERHEYENMVMFYCMLHDAFDEESNADPEMFAGGNVSHWLSKAAALCADARRCKQIGHLLAHHILHSGSIVGFFPTQLLLAAEMCPLTNSCKYFMETYGLFSDPKTRAGESSVFLGAIAAMLDTTTLVAENIVCKYVQFILKCQMNKSGMYRDGCDTVYRNQTIFSTVIVNGAADPDGFYNWNGNRVFVIADKTCQNKAIALVRYNLDGTIVSGWKPRKWGSLADEGVKLSTFAKSFTGLDANNVRSIFSLPTSSRCIQKKYRRGKKRDAAGNHREYKPSQGQSYPSGRLVRGLRCKDLSNIHLNNLVGYIISDDAAPISWRKQDPRVVYKTFHSKEGTKHCAGLVLDVIITDDNGNTSREAEEWFPPCDGLAPYNEEDMEASELFDGRRYFRRKRGSFDYLLLNALAFLSPEHTADALVQGVIEKMGIDTSHSRDRRDAVDYVGFWSNDVKDGMRRPWLIMKLMRDGTHVALYRVTRPTGEIIGETKAYLPIAPSPDLYVLDAELEM